ncbi:MAG: hypothetical protein JW860_05215 [Sedimentisphaerales bacterium]|nr:hypothetical protein [Sedimentisphaerales bacterium]
MFKKILIAVVLIWVSVGIVHAQVEINISTDKNIYQLDEDITVYVSAYNPTDETIVLGFSTTYQVTYIMDDIFDWSDYHYFSAIPTSISIASLDTYVWEIIHDQEMRDIYLLELGVHSVVGKVVSNGISPVYEFEVIPEPTSLLLISYGILVTRIRRKTIIKNSTFRF